MAEPIDPSKAGELDGLHLAPNLSCRDGVALHPRRPFAWVDRPHSMGVAGRWGDRQDPLDPALRVDERGPCRCLRHRLPGGAGSTALPSMASSAARAEHARARRRIPLACRSSLASRARAFRCSHSSMLGHQPIVAKIYSDLIPCSRIVKVNM